VEKTKIQAIVERVNEELSGEGQGAVRVAYAEYSSLRDRDVNAHYMRPETFEQLKENIGRTGALETMPLVHDEGEGAYEILSGHHRVKAAREAGLKGGLVLVMSGLSEEEKIAKQLAHNKLVGEDDAQTLEQMLGKITNPETLAESGFAKDMEAIKAPPPIKFWEQECKVLALVFLPEAVQKIEELEMLVRAQGADAYYLASREQWERFVDAVKRAKGVTGINSTSAVIEAIINAALNHIKTENDERVPEDGTLVTN